MCRGPPPSPPEEGSTPPWLQATGGAEHPSRTDASSGAQPDLRKESNTMKRVCAIAALALSALLLMASAALADSPHYIKGPTATVEGNSLTVSWKAAGLGNTVTSVDFSLTGTANVTSQCFTKSGNPVNGVPKQETVDVNVTGSFPVRNGQTTGSLTVSPLSTLTCTGNQQVRILDVSFDLTLTGDSLPPVHLTG